MGTTPTRADGRIEDLVADRQRIGVAWRELRRGASMLRFRELLYGDELEMGQVDTLDLLVALGPCRMRDLAASLRVDASTATRMVARLVDHGLVVREPDPDDARSVRVRLSERGARTHASMNDRRRQLFAEVLGGFEPAELHQFAELLERLVDAVDTTVARATGD